MTTTAKRAGGMALLAVLLALPAVAAAGEVSPELARELQARAPGDEVAVIVELTGRIDPAPYATRDRRRHDGRLLRALKASAASRLPPLRRQLEAHAGRRLRDLWLVNGVAATVPAAAVSRLAALPGVRQVRLDQVLQAPSTRAGTPAPAEWNIDAIGAPALWSAGLSGAGVVVAAMDTGVDAAHPDLSGRWRGGANSWFDAFGQHGSPADLNGHGTRAMGILVGGAAGGSSIGVAPGARWIAARIFDDAGRGSISAIHLAFQWLLDPDENPATPDAPDVVSASWSLGATGTCNLEFQGDIQALEAAGIAVVFAAGNGGPAAGTSDSPGNGPGGFAAGAVDVASTVAPFSSRGPSACDGSIFPALVAPGVDVWTADLSYGGFPSYTIVSGTSFAAPHVAGAMALLAEANPAAPVADLRSALVQGARDLGPAGPDDAYGHGMIDLPAALALLGPAANRPPVITSSPVLAAAEGALYLYQVLAQDPEGTTVAYALDQAPPGMAIGAASGFVTWTPAAGQAGAWPVTVRVTDAAALSATQSFTVQVAVANRPPVASGDAYAAVAGVMLTVNTPGVLANDSDPDGDPLTAILVTPPAHGTLALQAGGAFTYTAAASYSGPDAFSYAPSDGQHQGAAAAVTLTVTAPNQAPVAAPDSFSAPTRVRTAYTPRVLAILANDRDPDGKLVASSVRLRSAPSKGGTATVNADGTVSYAPRLGFKGTETFTYDVRDDRGAVSNVATVTIKVG